MRRTLFYDRRTGELLHSHFEVHAVEGGGEARLSAPSAATPDVGLAELVSRGLDPAQLGSLETGVAPESSRRTIRFVDVKTGRLRTRRRELADDRSPEEER